MSRTERSGWPWSMSGSAGTARMRIAACSFLTLGVLLVISGCTTAPSGPSGERNADPAGYSGGSSLPEPYSMPEISLTDTS